MPGPAPGPEGSSWRGGGPCPWSVSAAVPAVWGWRLCARRVPAALSGRTEWLLNREISVVSGVRLASALVVVLPGPPQTPCLSRQLLQQFPRAP